jgi:hypothetical protein
MRTSVDLIVYTLGGRPLAELTRRLKVAEGTTIDLAEQVRLIYLGPVLLRSEGAPGVLRFLLSVGHSVTASAAASVTTDWLHVKLKYRVPAVKVSVEKAVVEVEAGRLKRVIKQKLTAERARRQDR